MKKLPSHALAVVAGLTVGGPHPDAELHGQTVGEAARGDTIRVALHLSPGRLEVESHFPPSGVVIPRFLLWPWGGADFSPDLGPVEAFDEEGRPVLVRSDAPGEWQMAVGGGGFALRYSVDAKKDGFTGPHRADIYRPTLIEDLAVVFGRSWFLEPLDAGLALLPVSVTVTGPYSVPRVLGSVEGRFPDARYLPASMVVAGDLRRRETAVLGAPIRFSLFGDRWRFSDDDLMGYVERIVEEQARAMGFLPGEGLEVVLLEGRRDDAGGTADGGIITLFPDPELRLRDRDPQTLRLVAHEHFHRWLGEHAVSSKDSSEGRHKWFQEGVTEYMAYRTLIRTGFVEPADFVFKIDQYIQRYVENPLALSATADVFEAEYWDDDRLQTLAYDKGFVVGLAIDAMLQEQTGRQADIATFLRLVVPADGPVEYDDDRLLEALQMASGTSWATFYERYMRGSEPLPISEICRFGGFDCRRDRGGPVRLHPTNRTIRSLERLMR